MTSNTLCKIREVADHFRVTNDTVLGWIRKGKLEAVRISSGQLRVTEEAMRKIIRPVHGRKSK